MKPLYTALLFFVVVILQSITPSWPWWVRIPNLLAFGIWCFLAGIDSSETSLNPKKGDSSIDQK